MREALQYTGTKQREWKECGRPKLHIDRKENGGKTIGHNSLEEGISRND